MKEFLYKHARLFLAMGGLLFVLSDYLLVISNVSEEAMGVIFLGKVIVSVGGGILFGHLLTINYNFANTDYLTGINNRQVFHQRLDKQAIKCYKQDTELSMLFIDIDKFKKINDSYGHSMGDKVLIQVARILKENIRFSDTLARMGGEEFAILLPNTKLIKAKSVADEIREQVESKTIKFNGRPVTISIGVSSIKGSYDKEKLMRVSDSALYKAKETRNTVVASKN